MLDDQRRHHLNGLVWPDGKQIRNSGWSSWSRNPNGSKLMAKRTHSLSQTDYQALSNLRFSLRRFMGFSASAALEAGLPAQQHQALLAIKGHSGQEAITIGGLADRLLIAPHTATELVGRLVKGGLVERRQGDADRRKQTLELTPKANEILGQLSAAHVKEIRELAPQLINILTQLQNEDASALVERPSPRRRGSHPETGE
jgi:DNA-binding MarR family transcriptional regulator